MGRTTTWKGSSELQEQPNSPDWNFAEAEQVTCTRTFSGKYSTALSSRPEIGSAMAGYANLEVVSANVKKRGPFGDLTVVAATIGATKFEIDWVEIQKPLYQHPMFLAAGAKALTDADRIHVEWWEACPDAEVKAAFAYFNNNAQFISIDGGEVNASARSIALENNALFYAQKLAKGIDSFVVYAPVARKTAVTVERPKKAEAGFRQTPDGFTDGLPAGYMWLKTADRFARSGTHGRWERVEEWTGAESIDTDIYEEAGGDLAA